MVGAKYSHPPISPTKEERESREALPNTPTLFDYPERSEKASLSENPTSESSYSEFTFLEDEGGASSIDLIKGDISDGRKGGEFFSGEKRELYEFLRELKVLVCEESENFYFTSEDLRALWRVGVRGYKQIRKPRKLIRALKRLRRKDTCGLTGHLVVGVDKETSMIVKLKRANHSCRSVHCPYCQVRESRKRLSSVLSWFSHLLESGERLSFITITIPSSHNIFEHIAHLKLAFERFYQMRIGRRAWEQISKEFFEELEEYALNLRKKGYSDEEIRVKVERQIYFFEQFEKFVIAGLDENAKVKDIFRSAVWKFELTYNEKEGYHAHFHAITTVFMPKLLLTVLVRRAGLGAICDIRELRGRQGLVELSKYEAKYWELESFSLEEKLAVEVALLGFKKFRVWGDVERYKEDDGIVYFPLVSCRVGLKCNFIKAFKEAHSSSSEVEVGVVIDNETFVASTLRSNDVPVKTYRFEGVATMDKNGEIDLTNFLSVDGFRDFLRACLVMFEDFIHLCHPRSLESFLRKSRVVYDALSSCEAVEVVEDF